MPVLAAKAKVISSAGQPFTVKDHCKVFLACLSYANLCFLNVWTEIFDRDYDVMNKHSVTWQRVTAVALDIMILAAVAWGILYLALVSGNKLWIRTVKWAALIAFLVPFQVVRYDDNLVSLKKAIASFPVLHTSLLIVGAAIGLLALFNWERLATRIASTLLLLLAPSMPLAVANGAWRVWSGPPGNVFPNKPLQPVLPQPAGAPHVIWIIFDEWDKALTFPDRPAGLSLPEIDRFQSEAFHADSAYPPARMTVLSVPSLVTGKTFVDSKFHLGKDLMLTYDPIKPPVPLTAQSTVFTEARRRGFNIGIAGWYLPYCRLIPECTVCSWSVNHAFVDDELEVSVLRSMAQTFKKLIWKGFHRFGIDFDEVPQKDRHAASYREVQGYVLGTIADSRLNLIFLHLSIPHPPAIYLTTGDAISDLPTTTYVGNLRLVDRTIRDLRRKLEESGMWDASAILLTSDHPVRVQSWKEALKGQSVTQHGEVPFLLKMPGQKQGLTYRKPMQEIVTKDLLLAILNREVTTAQEVAGWIDHNPPHQ